MKTKSLVPALLALTLSLPALSSMAAPPPVELLGDPAPTATPARTITITPDTKYVNVEGGEVVKFVIGGQTFAWDFDSNRVDAFDLNRVTPAGMLDHKVTAYVSPNPLYAD